MNHPLPAGEALVAFAKRVLDHAMAARIAGLVSNEKGQKKFLNSLYHGVETGIRSETRRGKTSDALSEAPCYVFCPGQPFGATCGSIHEALDILEFEDTFLIVLQDGSAGIYRPEDRVDDTWFLTRDK